MGPTVLFQLIFTFIYSTFNKRFSVSTKSVDPKQTLSVCLAKIKKPTYFTIQLIFVTIYELHYTFGTIHGSHCTISTIFYFYLQYFQQKNFSFSKISRSQTDLRVCFMGFASWNFVNFVNLFYFIYILQICVLVCLDRKKNRITNPLQ